MKSGKIRGLVSGLLALGLFLGAFSCTAPTPAPTPTPTPTPTSTTPPEPIEIKVTSALPKTHFKTQVFLRFLDLIEEKSNGQIVCNYVGGPEVIPAEEQAAEAVRSGATQMAAVFGANYMGLVPGMSVLALSRISPQQERDRGVWDILQELHKQGGLRFVGRFQPGTDELWNMLFGKKKPTKLADLAGLKLGCSSPVPQAFGEALGMTWVQPTQSELYTALERGVVDALGNPVDTSVAMGFSEIAKYAIDHKWYISNATIIMSLDTWNKLPQDLQQAITDAYLQWEVDAIKDLHADFIAAETKWKDSGTTEFIQFSPSEAKTYVDTAYSAQWERQLQYNPGDEFKTLRRLLSE